MNRVSRILTLIVAIAGTLPSVTQAQVNGVWDTTALTRIDITAIKAPGLIPEHSIEIADGHYDFGDDGRFSAGDIDGFWRQKQRQYSVAIDRLALERLFREALEQTPGLIVNQVKLLKGKIAGTQLDNGIWGSESYEYRLDTAHEGHREIIRLIMTVNLAGHAQPPASTQSAARKTLAAPMLATEPQQKHVGMAVSSIVKHLHRLAASEQ